MPSTAALPTLIRNLTTVAENANVIVASVTPGRPAPIAQPAPAAPPPADDSEGAGDPGESESSSSSAAAATTAPQGPQAQAMTLNITACGTFAQLRSYLRELEQMKRVVAVSGLSISKGSCAEGSAEDDLTATVQAHVFTLPNVTITSSSSGIESGASGDTSTSSSSSSSGSDDSATKGEGDE
jgi:hypothetical protein